MADLTTTCPKCGEEIQLKDTIAAPLLREQKKQFEKEQAKQKKKLEEDALAKAQQLLSHDIETLNEQLSREKTLAKQRDKKLQEAQKMQAEMFSKEQALKDKERELDLTVQKKLAEAKDTLFQKAQKDIEQSFGLMLKEKDEKLSSMQKKIDDLQRRAKAGSEQLRGEAFELLLEEDLAGKFPLDQINPVAKGISGADVLQTVMLPSGQAAGAILWETKRTKNFSNEWITKLKTDQRRAKADIAILLSHTLPQGVQTFDQIDGVYVAAPSYALPLAIVIRQSLMGIASARLAGSGQKEKMALVYDYLTGNQFKQRVEAICEHFQLMQEELNKERTAMQRIWAKREKQIQGVIENTVGLYGDLEGIAGRAMPQIDGLELEALEDLSGDKGEI